MDNVHSKGLKLSPLLFIFATLLINRIGMSILFPILPFLVERFRSDATTLGLLSSVYAVAQFLATPALGAISDKYGRRPVLLICVLGSSLSYLMFGLAGALWVLFLSRLIDGITGGVAATAQAYIADTSTPENRSKNFGLTGVAFGLGFVLGPALGGALASINLYVPVFFAAALALMDVILGYFTLPESLSADKRQSFTLKDLNPLNQLADLLQNRRIRGFLWATFVFNFAFSGFTSIFVLFLNDRFQWGTSEAAVVFVLIGVVSTIVQGGLIRKWVPRYGEARLTVVGLIALAVGFGLIALTPPHTVWITPMIYSSQALLALGVGLLLPCLRGLISNRVSDREQGRTIGSAQGLQSLAVIFGPLWAGWSFDHLGAIAPFWMGAALCLLALGATVWNLREARS